MIPADKLCQKRGCPHQATHALRLCVPGRDGPDDRAVAHAVLGVKLCEEHLEQDDAGAWVSGEDGATMRGMLILTAGAGAHPDFTRIWSEGVPLYDAEVQEILQHGKPH